MSERKSLSCRQFRITGRVQGVFYRASTRDVAVDLKLTGYARNLADGSVEVLACGTEDAIEKLATWLQRGPPMASVALVESEEQAYRDVDGFVTA